MTPNAVEFLTKAARTILNGFPFFFLKTVFTLVKMYRRYFQLSQSLIKAVIPPNKTTQLTVQNENQLLKRWAGHAKWQNIKSTKEAADHQKSTNFSRISRAIAKSVRQNGPDPSLNSELRGLMEEAQKFNMPKQSVEKAIKLAQSQTGKPFWVVFSGPKGFVIGFEVTFSNRNNGFLQSTFAQQTKKLKLKLVPNFSHLCEEKGLIIADLAEKTENNYERALEHALEIGMDEIHECDNGIIFECSPERMDSYADQLSKKGYKISSVNCELDFKEFVKISEEEIDAVEKAIASLQKSKEEIIRAVYNSEKC